MYIRNCYLKARNFFPDQINAQLLICEWLNFHGSICCVRTREIKVFLVKELFENKYLLQYITTFQPTQISIHYLLISTSPNTVMENGLMRPRIITSLFLHKISYMAYINFEVTAQYFYFILFPSVEVISFYGCNFCWFCSVRSRKVEYFTEAVGRLARISRNLTVHV